MKAHATASAASKRSDDTSLPLASLLTLKLRDNHLSPSAFAAESLKVLPSSLISLDLANNRLAGPLPLSTFASLWRLHTLDLSNNGFRDNVFLFTSDSSTSTRAFPALHHLDLSRNAIDSLASLEHCLGIPQARQVDYTGISSSSVRRAVATSVHSAAPELEKLTIHLAENPLSKELPRRRKQREDSGPIPGQPDDLILAQQNLAAVLANMLTCVDNVKKMDRCLAENPGLAVSYLPKLEQLQALLSPVSALLSEKEVETSQQNGTFKSHMPEITANADDDETVFVETSAAARRKKLKEAEQAWAPL